MGIILDHLFCNVGDMQSGVTKTAKFYKNNAEFGNFLSFSDNMIATIAQETNKYVSFLSSGQGLRCSILS